MRPASRQHMHHNSWALRSTTEYRAYSHLLSLPSPQSTQLLNGPITCIRSTFPVSRYLFQRLLCILVLSTPHPTNRQQLGTLEGILYPTCQLQGAASSSKRTDTKPFVPDRHARLNPHNASPSAAQPNFPLIVRKIKKKLDLTQPFIFYP
jgi:hypothetical protein